MDATQTITTFTKGGDRLWTAGQSATDIYQESHHVIENGGTEEEMCHILEKPRHLAVYSFGTGKELDKDGKDLAIKALRLPESLKYLEDEDGKDYFFSPNIVEKIQQTRFEETVIKGATQPKFGGFNKNGSTRRGRNLYGNRESFLAEAAEGVCTDYKPMELIRHTSNDNCHNPATEPVINSVTKFIRNEEKQQKTQKTSKNISTTVHYSIPEDGIPPGSRFQHFIENWKKMTTQTWPLSVIQDGYKIQFN